MFSIKILIPLFLRIFFTLPDFIIYKYGQYAILGYFCYENLSVKQVKSIAKAIPTKLHYFISIQYYNNYIPLDFFLQNLNNINKLLPTVNINFFSMSQLNNHVKFRQFKKITT